MMSHYALHPDSIRHCHVVNHKSHKSFLPLSPSDYLPFCHRTVVNNCLFDIYSHCSATQIPSKCKMKNNRKLWKCLENKNSSIYSHFSDIPCVMAGCRANRKVLLFQAPNHIFCFAKLAIKQKRDEIWQMADDISWLTELCIISLLCFCSAR